MMGILDEEMAVINTVKSNIRSSLFAEMASSKEVKSVMMVIVIMLIHVQISVSLQRAGIIFEKGTNNVMMAI